MRIVGFKGRIGMSILLFINEALQVSPSDEYIKPLDGGCNTITLKDNHNKIGCVANEFVIAVFKQVKDNPGG